MVIRSAGQRHTQQSMRNKRYLAVKNLFFTITQERCSEKNKSMIVFEHLLKAEVFGKYIKVNSGRNMEHLQNIIEYYDELYPVSEEQKVFFSNLLKQYAMPAKILRTGCASGLFEHTLARQGHDVTGIDAAHEFIDTATRRRRMPNTAVRFFQMTTSEIGRFLGKSFYNCITCLEGALYFIHAPVLLRKFFYDCKATLAPNGCMIIHLPNIKESRQSVRIKLISSLKTNDENGATLLTQELERDDNRRIPVRTDVPVYIPQSEEIAQYAKEAGFTSIEYFKDWNTESCPPEQALLWMLR